MEKTDRVLKIANDFLEKKQRDPAHDHFHHKEVWDTCKKIIRAEQLKLDLDALMIAAFWHDVTVVENPRGLGAEDLKLTVIFLMKVLREQRFDKKSIAIIKDATAHHEFGDAPKSVEGKVLQDADKLEILSRKRLLRWYDAAKDDDEELTYFRASLRATAKWIPMMRDRFHFAYSKKLFDRRLEMEKSDKRVGVILKKFDARL